MINEFREWSGATGASWAAEWQRTDSSFVALSRRLIERFEEAPFTAALDIGCGAGELTLALAKANASARVTGVDISADLVAAAQARSAHAGLANAGFELADAQNWSGNGETPDLLVSRHGVMFFDDPVAAFANLRRLAAPGARLVFSCFRAVEQNPCFTEVATLLPPPEGEPPVRRDPEAPGPFAFADQARVSRILAAGGWQDIALEPVDFDMITGGGEDPVAEALAYYSAIGPAALAISQFSDDARATFFERLRALAEANCHDGVVALPAAAWIVTAHAP